MKKMTILSLVLAFVVSAFLAPSLVIAAETAVDVGNKTCPVMGGAVNGSDFVEYQGKRYGLCCPGCKSAFLADPEKYIAKLNATETQPLTETPKTEKTNEAIKR